MSQPTQSSVASALWITSAGKSILLDEQVPACGVNQVRVRTLFSGISRGTESLVLNGQVPASEHVRMRAPNQAGDFNFPVKYGYINVGIVEEGPEHLRGRNVFCLYPHQTHYVVPVEAVTLLPDVIPAARAVLCANMETAINALWDARPAIGDKISVVGAGVVGLLVAWLASRIPGCDVELIDINERRKNVAKQLGLTCSLPDDANGERDLIIHTSASEAGLQTAIGLAACEATVIELSWYGNDNVKVGLGGAFHSQRLSLKSSQVGKLPASHQARWDYKRRLQLALSLLNHDQLEVLISGECHFRELPAVYGTLINDTGHVLCHRIRYDE